MAEVSADVSEHTAVPDDVLTMLYSDQWRSLVRLSWLLLHDQGRAEEVVQDAFLALRQHRSAVRDPQRAVAYLRSCVVNGSRSALRHRAVEARWLLAAAPSAEVAGDQPSAEDIVVSGAEREQVLRLVRMLPTRQREVLVLRYFAELSECEIAQALGISRGAVKSHAHRGLTALRQLIRPSSSAAAYGSRQAGIESDGPVGRAVRPSGSSTLT